jgi:hypothetical protein
MSSSSKGKGSVKTIEWAKHLRPYGKKRQNKLVRNDGKKRIDKASGLIDNFLE